ncbi:MAG: hypothetical protein ACK6CT_09520 [Planctomycetia bacterium]|jgi:hypothetical protein
MLTPAQVVDTYFLEARHQLLEIAALLDRHDAALTRAAAAGGNGRHDARMAALRRALEILAELRTDRERTVALLELFATV